MQNDFPLTCAADLIILWTAVRSDPVEYPYLMIKEAGGAEGAGGAGGEVFWLGCLIMVNHPDLI